MTLLSLPAQNHEIQRQTREIDPIWYERLKAIVAVINGGTIGQPSLPANATTGFGYIPLIAGTPTGTPIMPPGYAAVAIQFVGPNAKLWAYTGTSWESTNLT